MRKIDKFIIHCSATREGQDISIDTIRKWHVEENGWSDVGYHYVVDLEGRIHLGRPIEKSGAHTRGENKSSIGICYIGGCDANMHQKDTRTNAQKATLLELLRILHKTFPECITYGHRDFSDKACPSFNAFDEYKNLI